MPIRARALFRLLHDVAAHEPTAHPPANRATGAGKATGWVASCVRACGLAPSGVSLLRRGPGVAGAPPRAGPVCCSWRGQARGGRRRKRRPRRRRRRERPPVVTVSVRRVQPRTLAGARSPLDVGAARPAIARSRGTRMRSPAASPDVAAREPSARLRANRGSGSSRPARGRSPARRVRLTSARRGGPSGDHAAEEARGEIPRQAACRHRARWTSAGAAWRRERVRHRRARRAIARAAEQGARGEIPRYGLA